MVTKPVKTSEVQAKEGKSFLEIQLDHMKTTKGAEMYGTNADNARVTNIYIRKEAFNGGTCPDAIMVKLYPVVS